MSTTTTTEDWGDDEPAEQPQGQPSQVEELVESVTAGIDRLLAAQDDLPATADLPGLDTPATPRPPSLLTIHGWPRRYTDPIDLSGGEWKAAFALLRPVIEQGGIGLLHGKRGNGKTRMAAEIARGACFPCDQTPGKAPAGMPSDAKRTPLYRTAMSFFVEVRATYGKKDGPTEKDVIERLANVGLLVIDELQERGDSPFEDRLLTHLIDRRYGAMLPTILIANLTHADLQTSLGPSALDRFAENGRRIEFTWDSYRRARR